MTSAPLKGSDRTPVGPSADGAGPGDAVRPRRPPRPGRSAPYWFLMPTLVLFAAFTVVPIGYAIWLSLHKVQVKGMGLGKGAREEVWNGIGNYTAVLHDSGFGHSVLRAFGYGLIVIPTMLGLALVLALMLDTPRARSAPFARLMIFLPYAVPGIIAALMWGFLYLPDVSPFYYLLRTFDLPQPDLFADRNLYLSFANIAVWGGTGFNMIVIYTALKAIPQEIYEAARIDGASDLKIATRLKIPIVMPSLVLTFFFSVIATLQVFTEPMALRPLTNGLPADWSPLMAIYDSAFLQSDIYGASATTVVLALATFLVSFALLRVADRHTREDQR
ncbi:sugar ABC transporter permease [Streptomyces sp. S3(2020)]|uniref:carbohydrate ABC transporter permease n=1 Tax=Streptomyces sp. S3(2020) TaxID=2732044 RepID=UPI001488FB95|nr:sugar ABC transporter permease [Streptomyces sp. S3(2020)]NNN30588.1 sugar ABC transporter permease [Streptomyces sp. S3(2020)]